MADDFAAIRKWVEKVEHVVDASATRRILDKAGAVTMKASLEAAAGSLGGDRRFGNWKRGPALSAGYDAASSTEVVIKFRGPWKLAEKGRTSSGVIRPKRARAVRVPGGLRARSSYGRSRGLRTYTTASTKASTAVPKAAHDQFRAEIRKVVG